MDRVCKFFCEYKRGIIGFVLFILFFWWLQTSPLVFHPHSADEVRSSVASFGAWGPLVYVGLYTVRPFLLIPSIFFNLSAGVLFGPWIGIVLLLLGGLGSALSCFLFGRLSNNKESLLQRYGGRLGKRIDDYLSADKSFMRMLWLRLVPMFPYDPVSLIAGCSSMSLRTYVAATFVGMLPGAIAYNFLAVNFFKENGVWIAAGLLLLAFGIPLVLWYCGKDRKAF